MKILLIGGAGQLGAAITRRLELGNLKVEAPDHDVLDITYHSSMVSYVKDMQPDIIINCSGYHDAKKCEENPDLAREINVTAVEHLGIVANQFNAKLIHFSTDQVLRSPPCLQDETSHTYSYDEYSLTKKIGESAVPFNHTIVRVSALYGHDPCRGKDRPNFVEQVIEAIDKGEDLELPSNVGCSPGYVEDIANQVRHMLKEIDSLPYVIHLSPFGLREYSWFHFASDINREYRENNDIPNGGVGITRKHVDKTTGLINMTSVHSWRLPPVRLSLRRYLRKRRELQ